MSPAIYFVVILYILINDSAIADTGYAVMIIYN